MEYVAIDFETASRSPASACSVGLVAFNEEGEKLDSYYTLLSPKELVFDPVCFSVHKLDPEEIIKAPSIKEKFPEMEEFIKNRPLVAHNAPFDIGVLKASLLSYDLEVPKYKYYCTLSLARKLWRGKNSYKLSYLASEFNWFYNQHNAEADAFIAGRLFSKLCGSNLFDETVMDNFFNKIYRGTPGGFPRIID